MLSLTKRVFLATIILAAGLAFPCRADIVLERSFSTGLFSGTAEKPYEIIMFRFKNNGAAPLNDVSVEISGGAMSAQKTVAIKTIAAGDIGYAKVTLPALPQGGAGAADFSLKASAQGRTYEWKTTVERVPPDWKRIHLMTHFHYDPVWINRDGQRGYALTALSLIHQYMNASRSDPTYTFAIEQIPYLKPFWDTYPEDRATIQGLIGRKQLELVGGAYDQPDESSVFGEGLIRNFYYGRFFEENVMGGKAAAAWQIDNFGHTPQFPQILKKSGMESFTFLRGGALGLPRQYLWIAPDGSEIFSFDLGIKDEIGKMMEGRIKVEKQADVSMDLIQNLEREILPDVLGVLRNADSVHPAFLPLGDDFMPPIPLLGTLTRYWKGKYVFPSLRFSLPAAYFKEALDEIQADPMSQRYTTKDMNPVYSGCYSSRTDIKIANRQAEMTYLDAEVTATIANLLGAAYPDRALDKALRELLYNDHHDSIPGTTNELSYLDILSGWRESLSLSSDVKARAIAYIAGKADTSEAKDTVPIFVMNPLSFKRTDAVEMEMDFPVAGLKTKDGKKVPFDLYKNGDGFVFRFTAADVPSMGYKIYYATKSGKAAGTVKAAKTRSIENEYFKVEVDPAHGGGIVHLVDKKSKRDWAAKTDGKLINTLFVMKDEGDLWEMRLSGGYSTTEEPAKITVENGKTFSRITAKSKHPEFSIEQIITLQKGVARVDFTTRIYNYAGQNKLFKLVFPVAGTAGLTPVYGERFTPEARKTGEEFPVDMWAGYSKALVLKSTRAELPVGVPAIIVHKEDKTAKVFVKKLIEAMSKAGTPSVTYFEEESPDTTTDSAIYVGEPGSFQGLVKKLGKKSYAATKAVARFGSSVLPEGDRPIWVIGKSVYSDEKAANKMTDGIIKKKSVQIVDGAFLSPLKLGRAQAATFAVLNNGTNGYRFDKNGTIELQLLRSVTGRPGGEAYSRALSKEDWNHTFYYSIVAGAGDFERVPVEAEAQAVNRPLAAVMTDAHNGTLPGDSLSFFGVQPQKSILVSALRKNDDAIPSYTREKKYDGAVIRLYSTLGNETPVALSSWFNMNGADETDMQGRSSVAMKIDGGAMKAYIGARSIDTFRLGIASAQQDGKSIGRELELVQPVYASYWRQNDNVSPLGYQPLTVSFDPHYATDAAQMDVKLKIASDYKDSKATGSVRIVAPDGWNVEPQSADYDIEPGGFKIAPVKVTPLQGATGGLILAYYENEGQKYYTSLLIGDVPLPGVEGPAEISIRRGGEMSVPMKLSNTFGQAISGEAVVVSPIGTWAESRKTLEAAFEPFRAPFSIPANGSSEFIVTVRATDNALPGSFWFAVKLMANGEYVYSKPVQVNIAQ